MPDASSEAVSQDANPEAEASVFNAGAPADSADAPADAPDMDPEAAAMPRIASLNLHCLKTDDSDYSTNEQRFQAIAQTIADEGIVAVAVQEACIAASTDALEMLRAAMSTSTGEAWSMQWVLAHVGWPGTPDEAQEDMGILARGPLSNVRQVEFRYQGALRRVMIGATLRSSGLRLCFVHLEVNETSAHELAHAHAHAHGDGLPVLALRSRTIRLNTRADDESGCEEAGGCSIFVKCSKCQHVHAVSPPG